MLGWGEEFLKEMRERLGCLGLLIALLLIGVGALTFALFNPFGGGDSDGAEGTPPADPTEAAGATTASPTVDAGSGATPAATQTGGRTTRVGNIDLEVLDVLHPYDSTQHSGANTANVRIELEASAAGDGGGYFTAFELSLLDDAGMEHGPSSCLDCPGNLDSLELGAGESGEGSAYFELPEGAEPAELIYRGSASGEEGRIALE